MIYMVGTLSSAALMLWAGGLTDQYKVKTLGPLFLGLLAISCILMAVNPLVWLLPVIIFCLRFTGQGMLSHISTVSMSRWYVQNRGKAVAISHLGYSFGEALLPMTFAALMVYFAWSGLWLVCSLILVCLIPVLWWLLREERSPQSQTENVESLGMSKKHWSRREMISDPLFWFMLPALIGPSAFVTAFFFLQEHYATTSGVSHLQLTAYFPVYTIVSVSMVIVSGLALDKFGAKRLVAFHQIPMVLGFFAAGTLPGVFGIVCGLALLGLSTGSNATLINGFWAEFYGTKNLGSIKAVGVSIMVLGSAIGPALVGVFLDLGYTLTDQFIWISVFFCVTSAFMSVGIYRVRSLFL